MDIKDIMKLDKILRLPTLHKVLILLLLCGAVGGVFYWGLIMPKQTRIVELGEKLEALELKVINKKKIAADIPRFRKEKEELDKKLALALEQLPNSREIPQLIKSINAAAKKSGLSVNLFQPKPEKPQTFYAEVPISMTVEGSYDSLYGFCDKISKLDRIVNIEGINVSVPKNISKELVVKSSFTAVTFRFIPESEQNLAVKSKKGKKKR